MATPSLVAEDAKASPYVPLNEEQDEIRLLTFVQPSSNSDRVCCKIETVSLKNITPEYHEFSATFAGSPKRKLLFEWVSRSRSVDVSVVPSSLDTHGNNPPPKNHHRFSWGDFAALSYVWGESNPSTAREIVVNGNTMLVGRNLEVALRALSSDSDFEDGYKLWVDALCINQGDLDERGSQVRKMRNIYGDSWTVIAWLGEEYQDSEKAFQLLYQMSEANEVDGAQEIAEMGYTGNGQWLALSELMNRPYWYRLWVIQEVVLANSSLIIRCGSSFIDWKSFFLAIGFLYDHMWTAKDDFLFIDKRSSDHEDSSRGWVTTSLHLVHQDLWELTLLEEKGEGRLGFGRLLDLVHSTEARDSRDMVYGLAGMMEPAIAERLHPDYTSTASEVFAKAIHGGTSGAPSWAADWTWNGRPRTGRLEGSTFWAEKGPPRKYTLAFPYKASGATPADYHFSSDGLRLTVKGFVVDRIDGLSAREWGFKAWARDTIIQPDNHVSIYGDATKTSTALYRTLMADRDPNGLKSCERHSALLSLPSTFHTGHGQFQRLGWDFFLSKRGYYYRWEGFRMVNFAFRIGDRRLDDYFTDTITHYGAGTEKDYSDAYSSFDRASKARRLMTTERGYLGWAPDNMYGSDEEQTRKGDLIVIVYGCDTPLVVRPFGEDFHVIGGCYVQGLMDGEAMDLLAREPEGFTIRDFVLS